MWWVGISGATKEKPKEIKSSVIEVQTRSNEICTSLAYSE